MKNTIYFIIIAMAASLLLNSCATILNGSTQEVTINTQPPGANVTITNLANGKTEGQFITPCIVELDRGEGFFKKAKYNFEFTHKDCHKNNLVMSGDLNPTYLVGNIFIGGLIGWLLIDPATGAMWKLDKNVFIKLESKSTSSSVDAKFPYIYENTIRSTE